jgi:hypothetical protein
MTSVRTATPDRVDTHSVAARDCLAGLSLKPRCSPTGAVDGAWPQRSIDPVIKLAAFIECGTWIISSGFQGLDLFGMSVDTTQAMARQALTMATDGQDL